jgi:DNA-3-methyladenine glycosylase II
MNLNIVNQKDVELLIGIDERFNIIRALYGLPPNWTRPPGFISLSKIILEQQVSLASAKAHFVKLDRSLGDFTPANVLELSDEEMRLCQISRQKTKYLRALSQSIINGDLNLSGLSGMPEAEVRKQLTQIKGIGDWTTDIYLMFCLQAKDIFPIGDIAVVNTVKELSDANTREEIILLSETWRPFRSLAAYFLWHYYLRKRKRTTV